MSWSLLGRSLRLAFYLRVPLITLFLVATLGPVSQLTSAHSLLGNLFDQQTDSKTVGWNIFTVSFAAFLLALAAVTTLNLTLHYGTDRFNDAPAGSENRFELRQARPGLTFFCGLVAAWILVITVILHTQSSGNTWVTLSIKIASAVVAFLAALLAALISKLVQLALTNPGVTQHPPPFLVFPAYRWLWLEKKFDALYCWPDALDTSLTAGLARSLKSGAGGMAQWPLQVFARVGQGYLSTVSTPKGPRFVLRSGHVFALTLSMIAFLTYFFVGLNKARIFVKPALVPGLAYVLLFLLVACWALSALSFFVDRYRFPLVLSVVVLSTITSSTPESDHFFRVETEKSVPRLKQVSKYLTPAAYLAERIKDQNHRRVILVATPGGGIQAAAWTAQVLSGLDVVIPDHKFRNSVAMISSVSGGSLGAMIYAASFADAVRPDCVAPNSMRSAIDEVAWGWTGPDFWRAVIPLFRRNLAIDRGWALEQKWAVINGLSPEPTSLLPPSGGTDSCDAPKPRLSSNPVEDDTYISDWASQGTRIPALIVNSTLVETGQHVVFSTTQFPLKNDSRGIVNFYDLYSKTGKKFDVRVNTAARLSASFPYVAPAARPIGLDNLYAPDFHFVDGGYYDNLGVDSLIGWLTSAFADPKVNLAITDVLVLQIRHFNPDALALGSRNGWSFQLLAPLRGFFNMWSAAAVHRDQNELNLFTHDFPSHAGPRIHSVTIPYCGLDYSNNSPKSETGFESCVKESGGPKFQFMPPDSRFGRGALEKNLYDCADQPLSWKLSQTQKNCVEETWRGFAQEDPNFAIQTIKEFLNAQ